MNACKQPFPLQIADVGDCRYFLRTRQLNSPFASIHPSVRPPCPLGNRAEVVSQAIVRMDGGMGERAGCDVNEGL